MSRRPTPKIFVITEGVTEKGYLEGLQRIYSDRIKFVYFEKQFLDYDNTDRELNVELLYGWTKYCKDGVFTPFYYSTCISYSICKYWKNMPKKNPNKNILLEYRKELSIELKNRLSGMGEAYITKNFEKFAREFAQSMYFEKFPNHNKLMEYFNFDILDDDCQKEKFGKYDHALFIFDRDYWEVQPFGESDEQHEKQSHTSYEVLLKSLSDYGCTAALSTPFFEFWLLLHHWNEELSKIEYKPYLDGSKNIITNRLKRIEKWSEKDNGKVLTDERKRFYGKNFEKALNALLNSSKFSKEPEDLIRNVGSNVGIVLKNWM